MLKALISEELVSLDSGIWSSGNFDLLNLIKNLVREFDSEPRGYHPQPELYLMEFVCEKMRGEIIYADEPDPIDPDVEY